TVFSAAPMGDLNAFARFQHDRWGTQGDTIKARREEDEAAMEVLGAEFRLLDFPDAIYRGDLYLSDDDLFGRVKPQDAGTFLAVTRAIRSLFDEVGAASLFVPLGVGGHVDHRLCQASADALLGGGGPVYFYEDFPYAATPGAADTRLREFTLSLESEIVDVSSEIDQRIAAIAAYASQVPTIFRHHGPFDQVVRSYAANVAAVPGEYGERFWRVANPS
ncbi:MAG TPA: PIG-L family deacetylase, partial [Chloroflexota bacterium]|nr:PIG-L family deacetylase [Chloroflexota bacterium]